MNKRIIYDKLIKNLILILFKNMTLMQNFKLLFKNFKLFNILTILFL